MSLTISQLAARGSSTVQAIRFYEREGLLRSPDRNSSGYRIYESDALTRLVFIHRAQNLGFSLKEIRDLIGLQTDQQADCTAIRHAAEEKLSVVEEKVADLLRMKEALQVLIGACTGQRPIAQCEILECLSTDDPESHPFHIPIE